MRGALIRRVLPVFLAALLCAQFLLPAAEAVTQDEIDDLKQQQTELNSEKNDIKKRLDAIGDDKAAALEKKRLLDEECAVIQDEIDVYDAQIAAYDAQITQTEQEIAETEEKEKAQYELFCKRARATEESGRTSYWEIIFKATSVTDLLSRIDFVNEIMDYDRRVIQDLKDTRSELEEKKSTLEEAKAEQAAARETLVERKAELDERRSEADALVKEIQSQEGEYQDALDSIEAEEEAIQAMIVKKSEEMAAQGNPNTGNATTGVVTSWMGAGGYMWPEKASKKITSPFGKRSSPGGIGSTNHKGVDIGGVGYTTQVLASKAGTVIVSQYSNSYGNYVVVSHGSGNTTLYAHMSSRSVSAGQYVQQGQVLGITGSTGNSTGPHLHFEITEGGVRVNPLDYLTGYVAAW